MQNLPNDFLICHYLNLVEVGTWLIISKYHSVNEEIPLDFLKKTFSLSSFELSEVFAKLIDAEVVEYIYTSDCEKLPSPVLILKRTLV